MAQVKVGTSGWSYDHWNGVFYPERLSASRRLPFYATKLPTVEVNATFYRTPSEHAVAAWRDEVPEGFAFSVKGSRFITHFRKLADVADGVRTFSERVAGLGGALEVVLWQLPPDLTCDPELLDTFLGELPSTSRHAVEFRNESWLVDEAFDVLRARNVAHVHVSSDAMPENLTVTADFVYVRMHGTATYHGAYTKPALEPWSGFLLDQVRAGRDGYAYFNNDAQAHAPRDAMRLVGMLGDAAYRLPVAELRDAPVAAGRPKRS